MFFDLHVRYLKTDDLSAIADVHLKAFYGSALTKLGREAVRRYYEWQLLGPHEVVALGAFQAEKLVGFCFAGVFSGASSGFLRKNRLFLASNLLIRPWLLVNPTFSGRFAAGIRLLTRKHKSNLVKNPVSTAPETSFGILAIAIHPQNQRSGIGKLLMEHAAAAACQRDFQQMSLTVHPENSKAIRFYESMGWEKTSQEGAWRGLMRKVL